MLNSLIKKVKQITRKRDTSKYALKILRRQFVYDSEGKPLLDDYGVFKGGVTSDEIDSYLRVRANKLGIKDLRSKFDVYLRGSTCGSVEIEGKPILLIYRHDVERFVDQVIDGKETYFD